MKSIQLTSRTSSSSASSGSSGSSAGLTTGHLHVRLADGAVVFIRWVLFFLLSVSAWVSVRVAHAVDISVNKDVTSFTW